MTVVWVWSQYTACRPVTHPALICLRIVGVIGFAFSAFMLFILVDIGAESLTDAYLLAICVILDGMLIVRHTWDYQGHTLGTMINCRVSYLVALQVVYPCVIATSIGLM